MKPDGKWKNRFRDAIYQCAELREHKVQRGLLDYIVHRSHSSLQMCWVSQREMSEVFSCNERNIKKMLVGLQMVGAILPVRFSALNSVDQKSINSLSPRPINNNSNVYFPCLGWAEDILGADKPVMRSKGGKISISDADRKKGSAKAASRKRRYPPKDSLPDFPNISTDPDHEEYLFLNALGEKGGLSGAPYFEGKGGLSGTRISIENNQAARSAPNDDRAEASFAIPSSKAEQAESLNSSLTDQHSDTLPHGYSGGEAGAPGQGTKFLAGLGGAHEETEYDAAGARAIDRRAS